MNNIDIIANLGLNTNSSKSSKSYSKDSYSNKFQDILDRSKAYSGKSRFHDDDKGYKKTENKFFKHDGNKTDTRVTDKDSKVKENRLSARDEDFGEETELCIAQAKENIVNLIEFLANLNTNNLSKADIDMLKGKLEALLSKMQSIQGNFDFSQSINMIKDMMMLMENNEAVQLDGDQNYKFIDILNKMKNNLEDSKIDVNKIDVAKIDVAKIDVAKIDDTKIDNTKIDNTKIDDTKIDDTKIDLDSANKKQDSKFNQEDTQNNSFNQNKKSLKSNSNSTVVNFNSNESIENNSNKAFSDQILVNGQAQEETIDVGGQLKEGTYKLLNVDKNDVIKQIVSKAKIDYNGSNSEIKIKLKPNILGEMILKLSMDKGIITAEAMVRNENVKQLIESNLTQLKSNLEEQGINISGFEVSVGDDSNFERQNMFNWNNGRKRRFNKIKAINTSQQYEQYSDIMLESVNGLDSGEMSLTRSSINLKA